MGYRASVIFSQGIISTVRLDLTRKLTDTSSEGVMKHPISNVEIVI
jgi:hypothetical protein